MTKRTLSTAVASLAAGALLSLGAAAIAEQHDRTMTGVVVTSEAGEIVVQTTDGRKTFVIADHIAVPDGLSAGDIVLVDIANPGSLDAERIVRVDEQIVVTADQEAERAVLGIVTAISPQQLLVETTTGGQAFVISPEKLFPPLPQPDQKVAVTYRTLEVHPPQHMATGLIVLPNELEIWMASARTDSQTVTETASVTESETLPDPAPFVETTPAAETEPFTESQVAQSTPSTTTSPATESDSGRYSDPDEATATLPQTGSAFPLLLVLGSLALGLATALRFGR